LDFGEFHGNWSLRFSRLSGFLGENELRNPKTELFSARPLGIYNYLTNVVLNEGGISTAVVLVRVNFPRG
jgi:hypothetical protein